MLAAPLYHYYGPIYRPQVALQRMRQPPDLDSQASAFGIQHLFNPGQSPSHGMVTGGSCYSIVDAFIVTRRGRARNIAFLPALRSIRLYAPSAGTGHETPAGYDTSHRG